jgi:hypothetical protein
MTHTSPLSFIAALKKDADGFADAVTLIALCCAVYVAGKTVGHWFGLWGSLTPSVAHTIGLFLLFWMICKAVWATIDYTIYAVAGALTDMASALVNGVTESAAEPSAVAPLQRETAVAYLHDFLSKRHPRQVSTDGAAPADPSPPSAA